MKISNSEFFSKKLLWVALGVSAFLGAGTPLFAQQKTPVAGDVPAEKKIYDQPTVGKISYQIEGARKISTDIVAAHLSLTEGEPFLPLDVAESIRSLYDTELFDYVGIEPILDPETKLVNINVVLFPRPILTDVFFRGNTAIAGGNIRNQEGEDARSVVRKNIATVHDPREEDETLEHDSAGWFLTGLSEECTAAGIVAGAPLDEAAIKRAARKIREKYRSKDYPFVEVSYEIKRNEETGTAYVVFDIKENLETRIASVDFIGNETFTDEELRGLIETTSWAWGLDFTDFPNRLFKFSWITSNGYFNRAKFETDMETLRSFYLNSGFLDVKIVPPTESELAEGYSSVNNEETLGYLPIEIAIDEGQRYRLGDIKIRGNKLGEQHTRFTEKAIIAMLANISPRGVRRRDEIPFDRIFSGSWYSPSAVDVATQKIREYYGEVGYLNTRVSVTKEPDIETGKVDLVFTVSEGEKSYLRSITIDGNNISKAEILLRDLVIAPGEVFDMVRMNPPPGRSRRR